MTVDLNHGSGFVPGRLAAAPALSAAINRHIDSALRQARAGEPVRVYLGASLLADPCARRVAYQYRGQPGEPLDGRALRIFAAGQALEGLLAQWLRGAGFELLTVDPTTGEQFAFSDGPIEGHADGIIAGGPPLDFDYPVLSETKGLNDRSWSELVKHGLQLATPIYYGQVNIYMAYLGLDACLFTALNKNTCELQHELVAFDLVEARRLIGLAGKIAGGWLPPRLAVNATGPPWPWPCSHCRFRMPCREGPP